MIADTTFLIDLLVGRESATTYAENNYVVTTAISVFEIYQGLSEKEKEETQDLFDELIVFPLTKQTASKAGTIFKELKNKGLEIDPEDSMIASIAIEKDISILTRNTSHFSRIEGITVEEY